MALKINSPSVPPRGAYPEASGRPDEALINIMLVDDDDDCRLLIRDAIAQCKVSNSVSEASNGEQALAMLRREGEFAHTPRPGLIYLDIEMPGIDGLETLRRIKADPSLRDIPVVMMTGVCEERQMQKAAELGANSYTLKPANAEQFLRTVLASTSYWLTIHQRPGRHMPGDHVWRTVPGGPRIASA
ncbi:MAG: response regulator [Tepidisphaeraceae bacterium]